MGNIACARGAIEAGCRFYAGYPITPSSEIMEYMASELPAAGGKFIQMEDEIASISAVIGACWAGLKAMTATSGPGFSLMMEGIGYAAWTETPCVIVDIQRAGPSTGQATRVGSGDVIQSRFGSHGDYMPVVLSPASVQEMYEFTIKCFNFAERFRVPSILLADEAVGHLREDVIVKTRTEVQIVERRRTKGRPPFGQDGDQLVPPMPGFGDGEKLLVTGSTHDEWGVRRVDSPQAHERLVKRINEKVLNARKEVIELDCRWLDDCRVCVVAYGFTRRSALSAVKFLRQEGKAVGFIGVKTIFPFADEELELAIRGSGVKKIFIPEMNMGQYALLLKSAVSKYCDIISYCQVNGRVIERRTIAEVLSKLL